VPDPLPSDARFRLDLDTLLTGDLVAAQVRPELFGILLLTTRHP